MPIYRTTNDIFKFESSYFDENWMNLTSPFLPPTKEWDYKKEMQIEDVDVWEVLYEASGGPLLYAAWIPYAEFYLLIPTFRPPQFEIETYYAKGAQKKIQKRIKELNMNLIPSQQWIEPENMWLYTDN